MDLQDPNAILQAINTLVQQTGATPVNLPGIPTLNLNMPTVGDISGKWQEFLQRAQNDPDIVKYYQNLLDQAQGDTNLAKSFIERDYQTGARQTTENLQGTLAQLGLTFKGENQAQQNTLNQRGIALTQGPNNTTQYAGGGQAGQEVADTRSSQALRQEAEQRSARQNIEKLGITREKGLTTAGQNLQSTATNLQQQKQQDVLNRANLYQGAYQGEQAANQQKSLFDQQSKMLAQAAGGDTSGGSQPRSHINPVSGVWDDNYFATGKTG